ncbi:MAG: PQQ-binding-like beta-propeller repeat protein [Planctomycetota bacterium]|nr:PQQ-binding-like beta-propeller repeat protein [Planctomycetota bacterium]
MDIARSGRLSRLALLYSGQGRYKAAIEVYHRMVKLAPNKSEYRQKLERLVDLEGKRQTRRLKVVRLCILLVLLLSIGGISLGYFVHARMEFQTVVESADREAEHGNFAAAHTLIQEYNDKFPFGDLFNDVSGKISEYSKLEKDALRERKKKDDIRKKTAIADAREFLEKIPSDESEIAVEKMFRRLEELREGPSYPEKEDYLDQAERKLAAVRDKIESLLASARELINKQEYDQAHIMLVGLAKKFPKSEAVMNASVPVVFETTVPHKAKLYIDDELKGETPLVEMLPMKNPVKVRFEAQGFAPKTIDLFPEREYKVTVLMDRAPLWRAAIDVENGAKLELEPVVWNGNMYLVSSYGEILVCSLEDGQLVESAALKDLSDAPENLHDVAADPTVSDGVMYLPSQDGFLYAINLDDLTLLWRFEVKDFLRSKPLVATHPLIGKKVIIFGTEEGKVYCVDDEGNQVWVASTGDSVTTHPVTDGESVFVTSTDSYAYKFSLEDGTRLARKATTAQIKGSPVLWGEMLCFGNDTGHFYVMRKSDLGILQCIPVARTPVTAPPIFVKGKVVLSSSPKPGNKGTANVIVLDSSTWGEVAALSLKGAISGSPVVAEGKLYVAFSSDVGKIHCYNIGEENGYSLQLHWKHNMTYRISARPLGHDGAVYVAAENGELIAFD